MKKKQGAILISRRAREISPFLAMEIFERAVELERSGQTVIHLEIGEPDWETPEVVREAGIKALLKGRTHYTHSLGHPELRQAIASWYEKKYGLHLSPSRVVVTLGSSAAMLLSFAVLLDPGAEVLMTDPHYPCYPKFVTFFEGVPVPLQVSEEDNFQFDLAVVRKNLGANTRALILNSPANPTGAVTESEKMLNLVQLVGGKATIVSDEVYHGLVYQGRAHSILEYSSESIVINGFSKLFAMTGWRLGYAIFPEELVSAVQKLQQNFFISAPDFSQFAAIAALTDTEEEIENRRCRYNERRLLVLDKLQKIGLKVMVPPTGAFYVFVNISHYSVDSLDFAIQLLETTGVAVTPGIDFGVHGEGFIRISYANSKEKLEEGISRLAKFLEEFDK